MSLLFYPSVLFFSSLLFSSFLLSSNPLFLFSHLRYYCVIFFSHPSFPFPFPSRLFPSFLPFSLPLHSPSLLPLQSLYLQQQNTAYTQIHTAAKVTSRHAQCCCCCCSYPFNNLFICDLIGSVVKCRCSIKCLFLWTAGKLALTGQGACVLCCCCSWFVSCSGLMSYLLPAVILETG